MKKYWWVFIGIIVLLVITNPSQSDFYSYAKLKGGKSVSSSRTGYYLIFSTFQFRPSSGGFDEDANRFIGIFKAFYSLNHEPTAEELEETATYDRALQDSMAIADSIMRNAEAQSMEAIKADN